MKQINLVCAMLAMIFVACTQSVTPVHSGSLLEELASAFDRGRDVEKTIAAQVTAALIASGLALPARRIIVNLAPADLPKEGSHYDLPIGARNVSSPALLAASFETPMPILGDTRQPDLVGPGELGKQNERQPHAPMRRRSTVPSQIKAHGAALPFACSARLSRLSDARCPRWRTGGEKERQFPAWWSDEGRHERIALR
jgi:hypothetical protein